MATAPFLGISTNTAYQGSDLAALPQGLALLLILQEMRVQSYLLQQLVSGQVADEPLDDLRDLVSSDLRVVTTTVAS